MLCCIYGSFGSNTFDTDLSTVDIAFDLICFSFLLHIMVKRKLDDIGQFDWHPRCVRPKWPIDDADWTAEDLRSAISINSLGLDGRDDDGHAHPPAPEEVYVKSSRLIQALDLANFDDWDIETPTAWVALPPIVLLWMALQCVCLDTI